MGRRARPAPKTEFHSKGQAPTRQAAVRLRHSAAAKKALKKFQKILDTAPAAAENRRQ
jgi:hypothetical protein